MTIRALVWNENVHEQTNDIVRNIYPIGIHGTIAETLNATGGVNAETATMEEPEHGLTADRLAETDVLLWWGHAAHGDVDPLIVDRVVKAIWSGMGFVALHSSHFSRVFRQLMGDACSLTWREAGERERLWVTSRNHPIATGLPDHFELQQEEMYGEPFSVPEPLETVFVSWFEGGEVFRSGLTYKRGAGNIFYFRPGHETYPTYHDPTVQMVLRNAVHWAHNPARRVGNITDAPNVPVADALEPITEKGPRLHQDGQDGYR